MCNGYISRNFVCNNTLYVTHMFYQYYIAEVMLAAGITSRSFSHEVIYW